MKEWLKKVLRFLYEEDFKELDKQITDLKEEIDTIERLGSVLKEQKDYKNQQYWNTKWKQSKVFYAAPKSRYVVEYLQRPVSDKIKAISKEIIKDYALTSTNIDEVPKAVMNWVDTQNFKYELDKTEEWADPDVFFSRKTGDCDDNGVLEYYLIRQIIVSFGLWEENKHRLKCVDGHVHHPYQFYTYAGRHFWLIWLAEDSEFYTVETTFYKEKAIKNWLKLSQKLNPQYGTINYTFTDYVSFAQNSVTVSQTDYKKV